MTLRILYFICVLLLLACSNKKSEPSKSIVTVDSSLIYLEKVVKQIKEKGGNVPEVFERIILKNNDSSTLINNIKQEFENQKKDRWFTLNKGLGKIVASKDLKHYGEERYFFSIERTFERFNYVFKIQATQDTLSKSLVYLMTINRTMNDRYKHAILLDEKGNSKLLKDTNAVDEQMHITQQSWNSFKSRIEQADFWALGENTHHYTDGSSWILEGAALIPGNYVDKPSIKYHRVYRQSPHEGSFQDACLFLIELYKKDIGRIY